MGKFILDLIDRNNAFILTILDKLIGILNVITTGGRKMTVTIFAVACLTILEAQSLMVVSKVSDLIIFSIAGVVGFFYGVNLWADHNSKSTDTIPGPSEDDDDPDPK